MLRVSPARIPRKGKRNGSRPQRRIPRSRDSRSNPGRSGGNVTSDASDGPEGHQRDRGRGPLDPRNSSSGIRFWSDLVDTPAATPTRNLRIEVRRYRSREVMGDAGCPGPLRLGFSERSIGWWRDSSPGGTTAYSDWPGPEGNGPAREDGGLGDQALAVHVRSEGDVGTSSPIDLPRRRIGSGDTAVPLARFAHRSYFERFSFHHARARSTVACKRSSRDSFRARRRFFRSVLSPPSRPPAPG